MEAFVLEKSHFAIRILMNAMFQRWEKRNWKIIKKGKSDELKTLDLLDVYSFRIASERGTNSNS